MTGRIDFPKTATASVGTPPAGYDALFFDANGAPKYKDEAGIDHSMGGLTNWFDVTAYGILTTNTAAANNAAMQTLLGTTAPSGSTIYFPGGIYQFSAKWTGNGTVMPNKMFIFQGQGRNRAGSPATAWTEIQLTANLSGSFITLIDTYWYTQFLNMTFTTTVAQTAGAVVATGSNVGINFRDCTFQGTSATATLFNCIDYTGAQGANSSIVDTCNLSGFTGSGIIVNGGGSSLCVVNSVIQGLYGSATQAAVAGISCRVVGALQIVDCDLIGSINNLLMAPQASEVCASVHVTNSYFDNALGSGIKITGAGATVRCKFDNITSTTSNGGTAFSAVEMSSTFAYTTNGQSIDFYGCNFLNTFATTGTTNGMLVSGNAELGIYDCRIAGWTNGVQVTPIATAGRTKLVIQGSTIGATGDYPGNTTGVLLNVGAAAYGAVYVCNNILRGNTGTAISDASAVTAPDQKVISNNIGALITGSDNAITATAAVTTELLIAKMALPIGSLRVGSSFEVEAYCNNTVTAATITFRVKIGVNGTAADTLITSVAPATTAATDSGYFKAMVTVRSIGSGGTCIGNSMGILAGLTATAGTIAVSNTSAAVTVNTTVANFIDVTLQSSTGTLSVYNAAIKVIQG